jgi:hypothetical protein
VDVEFTGKYVVILCGNRITYGKTEHLIGGCWRTGGEKGI